MRFFTPTSLLLMTLLLLAAFIGADRLLPNPPAVAFAKSAAAPLTDDLTYEQQLARRLAYADSRVQNYIAGQRTELFGVARYLDTNSPASVRGCTMENCYIVNIFNFDASATVQAFVRVDTGEVVEVYHQPGIRAGINRRLSDRALEIALNEPTIMEILGEQPASADWAPMDSSLVGSACEQGHMCVAPTFDMGDYILWAIVDLTDDKFLEVFWTATDGSDAGRIPYPDAYADAPLGSPPEQGCPAPGVVTRDGWLVNYNVTGTDGLRVSDVIYDGALVIRSAKLAEWHVDYGESGFQDVIGCGGGGGGYQIPPYGDTAIRDLTDGGGNVIGFEVVQDFRMNLWGATCNYRYDQHFQFYNDGRFRTVEGAYGKGCAQVSTYRGLMRVDLAAGGTDEQDSIAIWDGDAWQPIASESRWCPEGETHPDCAGQIPGVTRNGYRFRILDAPTNSGFYVQPGRGQLGQGERGDFEFVYALAHHPEEGDEDLGVFSVGCCNNYEHGPEQYINGESISDSNLVLWYVPQMATDAVAPDYYCWTVSGEPNPETYPCFSGPMFIPFSTGKQTPTPTATGTPPTATPTVTGTPPTATPTASATAIVTPTATPPVDDYIRLYLPLIRHD